MELRPPTVAILILLLVGMVIEASSAVTGERAIREAHSGQLLRAEREMPAAGNPEELQQVPADSLARHSSIRSMVKRLETAQESFHLV